MARSIKGEFSGFGSELIERLREDAYERLGEAAFDERLRGIENATAALYEAKVEDERIISLLQKYWDLRLSEAEEFLQHEKTSQE